MAFDNGGQGGFTRQMFKGDWQCSKCSAKITELPFEPDPARMSRLLCSDCWRAERKGSFDR